MIQRPSRQKINFDTYMQLVYQKQLPFKEVAEIINVSVSSLIDFRRRHNLPPRGWANGIPPRKDSKMCKDLIKKLSNLARKRTGEKNPYWKGGQYINSQGYKMIRIKTNNYIREHRYIMEQFLKRSLERTEVVHHKNGNKIDNRIENLQILTRKEHLRLHYPKGSKFGIHKSSIN